MIKPTSEQELSEILAQQKSPLRILGGGTRRDLGNPVASDAVLSTSALTGIKLYEPDALTLVAKAGTPLSEIKATLAAQNQQLPFEPMEHNSLLGSKGSSTIGGVVAANISGPRRIQAGACRDSLIGVRFVDGSGNIIKNGGRVMKNVTGYDLVKLMAGSYGTLGVLTEVSFKVLPAPETQATIIIDGVKQSDAAKVMAMAHGSPNDVTGSAFAQGQVFLRIEGLEGSVRTRSQALVELYPNYELQTVTTLKKNKKIWDDIGNVAMLANNQGDIWRLSVKPSDGPIIAENFDPKSVLMDWAGGLLWIATESGFDMRAHLGALAGHASLIKGEGQKAFHPEPSIIEQISQGLRSKFDPKNILNTGIMG